jgi:hypothetical protein
MPNLIVVTVIDFLIPNKEKKNIKYYLMLFLFS